MTLEEKIGEIAKSALTIYTALGNESRLFLTTEELRSVLDTKLRGLNLDYPNRTRSKIQKQAICAALGYPIPSSFKRTQPRFPGQDFDSYGLQANNLQIWNEKVAPMRRYALIKISGEGVVTGVKVITGEALAKYDRTGTLTSKVQAKRKAGKAGSALVGGLDTDSFRAELKPQPSLQDKLLKSMSPTEGPAPRKVLTIGAIYDRLQTLIGSELVDPGHGQERLRGAALQELVCSALGLAGYADNGQHPDILSQALEVKLQTASTIDLGLVSPDSTSPVPDIAQKVRHCDIRYAVFYANKVASDRLNILEVIVSTGAEFFDEFVQFGGKVTNRKLQIPIPNKFFE